MVLSLKFCKIINNLFFVYITIIIIMHMCKSLEDVCVQQVSDNCHYTHRLDAA